MKRSIVSTFAFSLVELTLAIGIAGFCLIAVFGLMPVGVQANRNATSQTAATSILSNVIADMRATPKTSTTSAQFGINIPTNPSSTSLPQFAWPDVAPCSGGQTVPSSQIRYVDGQGQATTSIASSSRYRLIVTFVRNTTATPTTGATYANVKTTWPPAIDPCATTPSGSVETFAAFDRR
jgi:type II secretory pathway pseudopilin PulG